MLALAWLRRRFFRTGFVASFAYVTLGGALIVAISAALGLAVFVSSKRYRVSGPLGDRPA